MKWCRQITDIPKTPHYAIVEESRVTIPGDERSRTHPGHGYPETTEHHWDYIVFSSYEEWKEEITQREERSSNNKKYIAISATPAVITKTITVDITQN